MATARKLNTSQLYSSIRSIDGRHPLRDQVPGAYVDYAARKRHGGKVIYFNFNLAKDMGLIPKDHEHKLSHDLTQALLDTFSIQIINEYDIINKSKIPKQDIKEHQYMATRYLQLQHPNKQGLTSGDGRSLWNGFFKGKNGVTWDISSCGTGATCLSPASAINKKFYKTGDPSVSYGCGYSDLLDGFGNAIFSEVIHRNNIRTERTLCVIEYAKGLSINVRAGKNLLRPSHFFNHLKQENFPRLQAAVDYFIERQINNKEFNKRDCEKNPYAYLLDYVSTTFSDICAQFENEYIFCWLDWDGDNILIDGGIIDYGSIRQFGLFHHEYRYDDVERWSTTITEQKSKARHTVQVFAQMCDYLAKGRKRPLSEFSNSRALKNFDRNFQKKKREYLLGRIGFNKTYVSLLMKSTSGVISEFEKVFSVFERTTSSQGLIKIEDGITKNAVFCMRDILRELPPHFLQTQELMLHEEFIDVIKSEYATRRDTKLTANMKRNINRYQKSYRSLIHLAAKLSTHSPKRVLKSVTERSAQINRYERVTGDSIIHIGNKLLRGKNNMTRTELVHLVEGFIELQVLDPDAKPAPTKSKKLPSKSKKIMENIVKIVRDFREGI